MRKASTLPRAKDILVAAVGVALLALISVGVSSPTASFKEDGNFGRIVVFQSYGWPMPMVHGAFPDTLSKTPEEAVAKFLWKDSGGRNGRFALMVVAGYAILSVLGLSCLITLGRWIARTRQASDGPKSSAPAVS